MLPSTPLTAPKPRPPFWPQPLQRRPHGLMTFDALNALHARLRRLRENCLAEFGLTHAQLRVIAVIHPMKSVELGFVARTLDVSRQAVHRIVRHLEAAQFLVVERGDTTGRPLILTLDPRRRLEIDAALDWESEWVGREVAQEAEPQTHDGMQSLSLWLRRVLPWRVDGIDALAQDPIRYPWWEAPAGPGCAALAAASR